MLSAVLNLHPTEQPVWDCPANWRLNTVGYSIVSRIILLDTTRFESLIIICPVNSVSARSKSFRWLHWYLLLTTSGSCWDQGGFSLSPCLVIGTWLYLLHWGNLTLLWRRYWSLCTVWHSHLFLLWSSGFPHLQVNPLNKGVVMHYTALKLASVPLWYLLIRWPDEDCAHLCCCWHFLELSPFL